MNFYKSGQYRESITDFNKAIEIDPAMQVLIIAKERLLKV